MEAVGQTHSPDPEGPHMSTSATSKNLSQNGRRSPVRPENSSAPKGPGIGSKNITLTVNGQAKTISTDPTRLLLDVLREDFGLTGTKYGCGEGRCGACAVLVDGRRELSCQMPVGMAEGKKIVTIEGLAVRGGLHAIQQAFLEEGAAQCGYCTPGMIVTAIGLLEKYPNPSEDQIREWMNGNLCRCNNYPKIVRAIRRAAGEVKKS